MGPSIQREERSSQATPFAEDFLKQLQGILSQSGGAQTDGPRQQNLGGSPAAALGGVNTAAGVRDQTPGLIDAITRRSNIQTDRNAAQVRESFGAAGNRLSASRGRVETRGRNEAGFDLAQIIAGILSNQAGRETQAEQFDVGANQQFMQMLAMIAGQGIIPEELIVGPGIGQQLLTGGIRAGAAVLSGGTSEIALAAGQAAGGTPALTTLNTRGGR